MTADGPVADSAVLPYGPIPSAAALWRDQPDLFDRLRRRLASYAPNRQRALAADWSAWRRWCEANDRRPFPARAVDLIDYVSAHSPPLVSDTTGAVAMAHDSTDPAIRRATTVHRWLASLSTLHRIADVGDPTRSDDVKAARRTLARGRGMPEQKAALRWPDVSRALEALGSTSRDLRAKALIAVAYSTVARRAELIELRVEDLMFSTDGDGTVTLWTKGGHIHERYLAPEARAALESWLDQARIESGPVFRRLERHGGTGDRTIATAEVARTFKRIATLIGLDPTSVARINAHSARIGAAQDLTASEAALPEIMLAGGKSPQMPTHYVKSGRPMGGPCCA
jgi:integrase